MGVGSSSSSWFTPDEVNSLTAFSSPTPWAFDAEEWMTLLRTKWALDTHPLPDLLQNFKDVADRLVHNDSSSHNVATLCAHVASRLPRTYYFTETDIEVTRNAVVLLRLALLHLWRAESVASGDGEIGPGIARVISTHIMAPANAGRTANPAVDSYSLRTLVTSCIDYLLSPVKEETYDLHVQVLDLLLVMLSPQVMSKGILSAAAFLATYQNNINNDSATAGVSTGTGSAGTLMGADTMLAQAMTVGRESIPLLSAKGEKTNSTAVRADAIVVALLKMMMFDTKRDDEDVEVGEGSAMKASLECVTARAAAFADIAEKLRNKNTSTSSGKDSLLMSVATAASGLASLPTVLAGLLPDDSDALARPLGERAALFLMLLAHNCRSGIHASVAAAANPYRDAVSRLADADSPLTLYGDGKGAAGKLLPVAFKGVFSSLISLCSSPLGTATLYTLLHASPAFTDYALTRSNIEELLLPCLTQLYYIAALAPQHRYILLVLLLLFSQDSSWCETVHRRITLKSSKHLPFFQERLLGDVTLGSFIIILLSRAIMSGGPGASAAATADPTAYGNEDYLHTNCLAVIANMAPYAENLHPYAAQRLVSLLAALHRKYKRAAQKLIEESVTPSGVHDAARDQELERQRRILSHADQCIRMVLEAMYAACAPSVLPTNVTLLYAMLRERSRVFDAIASEPAFADAAAGLIDILGHFAGVLKGEELRRLAVAPKNPDSPNNATAPSISSLPAAASSSGDLASTVIWEESEVSEILVTAARCWRGGAAALAAANSLKETKYAYEEDHHPELFFVPYIWNLVLEFTPDCGWSILKKFSIPRFPVYQAGASGAKTVSSSA